MIEESPRSKLSKEIMVVLVRWMRESDLSVAEIIGATHDATELVLVAVESSDEDETKSKYGGT